MQLLRREKYLSKIRGFYHATDLIKVITGVRRCGKSSLLQTIALELQEQGVAKEAIIFIDLDRRGFRNVKTQDSLEEIIELASSYKGTKYLFIDEIQNVTAFEELINGFRTDGDYSIFITGSNSYLLSGELATKLTGRYIETELFTLTFEEYVQMKQLYKKPINPDKTAELDEYILNGGFREQCSLIAPQTSVCM